MLFLMDVYLLSLQLIFPDHLVFYKSIIVRR